MIPLLQAEVVDQNQWLTKADFIDALAIGNSLPGPIATKMSAYVGFKIAGAPGAVAALAGMVLPSTILMLVVALLFWSYKDAPQVKASLKAVRPAIVALLAVVVYDMFPHSVTSWHTGLIALATFVIIVYFNLHPAFAIAVAALLGVLVY